VHITSSVLAELEGDEHEIPLKDGIKEGSVSLHNLTSEYQTALATLMMNHSSRLSEPDCSCLFLALKLSGCILTCEKLLTNVAKNKPTSYLSFVTFKLGLIDG
jgi:hypothetical protein